MTAADEKRDARSKLPRDSGQSLGGSAVERRLELNNETIRRIARGIVERHGDVLRELRNH